MLVQHTVVDSFRNLVGPSFLLFVAKLFFIRVRTRGRNKLNVVPTETKSVLSTVGGVGSCGAPNVGRLLCSS